MKDWPNETTLKALLDLPGVSGPSIAIVERFLASPQMWRLGYDAQPPEALSAEATAQERDAHQAAVEKVQGGWRQARQMMADLEAVLLAHWGQLVATGKV